MKSSSKGMPIPYVRNKRLNVSISVPIDADIKKCLYGLKVHYGLDPLEWIRSLVNRELPDLVAQLEADHK